MAKAISDTTTLPRRSLMAVTLVSPFLPSIASAPMVPTVAEAANGNDPLVELWAKRSALIDRVNVADLPEEVSDAMVRESHQFDLAIAGSRATSVTGMVVQAKLIRDIFENGLMLWQLDLVDNLIASLEGRPVDQVSRRYLEDDGEDGE